jgi:hypothetical protein
MKEVLNMAHKVVHENAWLYRVYGEKFECFTGKVLAFETQIGTVYRLVRADRKGSEGNLVGISGKPGEVYEDTVWLTKRNDNKARQIFRVCYTEELVYHSERISRLNSYILTVMTGEL